MMKEPMPLAELVNAIGVTIDNVYDDEQDGWESMELEGDFLTLAFLSSHQSEFESASYTFKLVRE